MTDPHARAQPALDPAARAVDARPASAAARAHAHPQHPARARLDGGYGDDAELETYLAEQEGLLKWKARGDADAVQEARITVWQTLAKHPGATRSYLDQAATWRIHDHLAGKPATGTVRRESGTRTGGDQSRTARAMRSRSGSDALAQPWAGGDALDLVDAADQLPELELAYHHGEIMQAIAALPAAHREYVVLRFWGDLDRNQIAARMRRNPGNLATTWRTQIRPRLQESLMHLAAV